MCGGQAMVYRFRSVVYSSCVVLLASVMPRCEDIVRIETEVPSREITNGPKSHWFAYYDKYQFDPSGRYVLGMEIGFDNRSPTPEDEIRLGMVDLHEGDRWIEIGRTHAWSWQQGCMLQWVPGSESEVIYNDRRDGRFISVIKNVFTGEVRVMPRAVYTVSPDGKRALSLDFARVNDTRPGYGYVGLPYDWSRGDHPEDDGIYEVDLVAATSKRIISLAQIVDIDGRDNMKGVRHWFNHLLYSPDGSRFILLHRWKKNPDGKGGRYTRMFTANADGNSIYNLSDHGMVSHFIWKNPRQILAWARRKDATDRFCLFTDRSDQYDVIGEGILTRDGHCTYSPDGRWILTDTYPDKERMQNLMLYNPSTSALVKIGRFYLPPNLTGEWRCDLHGRWSRDGKTVCIDSAHSGQRQMVILDVSGIVK